MKRFIYILSATSLILCACNSGKQSNKEGNKEEASTSQFSKSITLPDDPCKFITKEMVTSNYNVTADQLEETGNDMDGYSQYETCTYSWKKKKYDSLQNKQIDMAMSAAMGSKKKGGKKASIGDMMSVESPYNTLGVGKFRQYDDVKSAIFQFKNLHHIPSKEDMEKLKKEFDKEAAKKGLNEDQKKMGHGLSKGIHSNLKFSKVEGIGDEAYYDYLDKSLDVRFGKVTFSLIISTEDGYKKDIEVAKKLVKKVWSQL